jgi:hypothetical protein
MVILSKMESGKSDIGKDRVENGKQKKKKSVLMVVIECVRLVLPLAVW